MVANGLTRFEVSVALVAGLLHAILALWLNAFVRGDAVSSFFPPQQLIGLLLVIFRFFGLVTLGAVPVALFLRNGLVAPGLTLVISFAGVFVASLWYFEEARSEGLAASTIVYVDSLYMWFWFVPLAVVFLVGRVERFVRRRL